MGLEKAAKGLHLRCFVHLINMYMMNMLAPCMGPYGCTTCSCCAGSISDIPLLYDVCLSSRASTNDCHFGCLLRADLLQTHRRTLWSFSMLGFLGIAAHSKDSGPLSKQWASLASPALCSLSCSMLYLPLPSANGADYCMP